VSAARAWLILLAAVSVYELRAADDQLLTRAVDRARATHPAVNAGVCAAITVTALHLLRVIPAPLDPFRLLHAIR
jgi:hypothetical protein